MDASAIFKQSQMIQDLIDRDQLHPMKIEVLDGQIVMQAAPRWEHSLITDLVKRQLPFDHAQKLSPVDLVIIGQGSEPQPDITVIPERLAPGAKPVSDEVLLVVEISSESNADTDYGKKSRLYSLGGVPQYLIIDPVKGICTLRTHNTPEGGWVLEHVTTFGEPVKGIACMQGEWLDTSEFPIY